MTDHRRTSKDTVQHAVSALIRHKRTLLHIRVLGSMFIVKQLY